jgi:hypothetical protein
MTRYKITVRGTDIELRGYLDGEGTLRLTAKSLEGIGLVVASEAPDGWNPFAITEPDYPPSLEKSIDVLTGIGASADSIVDLIEKFAAIHFGQAQVIRGERYLREQAEAELRDRELHHFEVEQENASLKASRDQYTRDMVTRVNEAEGEVDQMKAGAAEIAQALSDNWEQGDLAGAVNEAIEFLRGMEEAK